MKQVVEVKFERLASTQAVLFQKHGVNDVAEEADVIQAAAPAAVKFEHTYD